MPYSSIERLSRPTNVCYALGRQDHYKNVYSKIECHKCYKKEHISRECPLRESGHSSGHIIDRTRHYEQRTKNRDRSPLHSRHRYKDECSASVCTVRFASRNNIIDGHCDRLFAECLNSVKVTRYVRVSHLCLKRNNLLSIVAAFLCDLC